MNKRLPQCTDKSYTGGRGIVQWMRAWVLDTHGPGFKPWLRHTPALTLEGNLSLTLISSFNEVILSRSGQCPAQITIWKDLNSTDGMASRHLIVKFISNNSNRRRQRWDGKMWKNSWQWAARAANCSAALQVTARKGRLPPTPPPRSDRSSKKAEAQLVWLLAPKLKSKLTWFSSSYRMTPVIVEIEFGVDAHEKPIALPSGTVGKSGKRRNTGRGRRGLPRQPRPTRGYWARGWARGWDVLQV